jgi:peroxiredoxin
MNPEPLTPGTQAPDFTLPDLEGQTIQLGALRGKIVVITFWSVNCPWAQKYDAYFEQRSAEWGRAGIVLLAINSNADEPPEHIRDAVDERGLTFRVLLDEGNPVADAYGALTTPHVYIVDQDGVIVYQGAVDDTTFRQREPTVNYVDEAVAALLAGDALQHTETPAVGCTIVRSF